MTARAPARDADPPAVVGSTAGRRLAVALRAEDWLLAAWMVVVAPLLAGAHSTAGPFDAGRPLDGLLAVVGVVGAIACIAARRPDGEVPGERPLLERASVGPFTGGLLLVAVSGASGLGLVDWQVTGLCVAAIAVAVAVRFAIPPIPVAVRRALVMPFVLAAGGIFGDVIGAVTGTGGIRITGPGMDLGAAAVPLGFLVAFSAVYYAMLVYAPRQVAEREGGAISWVLRYGAFLAGTLLGFGWLRAAGA